MVWSIMHKTYNCKCCLIMSIGLWPIILCFVLLSLKFQNNNVSHEIIAVIITTVLLESTIAH